MGAPTSQAKTPAAPVDDAAKVSAAEHPTPQPQPTTQTATETVIDFATGLPVTSSTPTPTPAARAPEPSDTPAAAAAPSAEGPTGEPKPAQKGERMFTQAEVEAIVKDRLSRVKQEGQKKADRVAAEVDAVEQVVTAQLTDLQTQIANLTTQQTAAAVRTEIAVAAQRMGVDAGLATKLIDWQTVKVKDGQPESASVQAALDALVAEHPNLRVMPALSPANPARSQSGGRSDADRQREYFGGGGGSFWQGGGVVMPTSGE